MGGHGPPKVLSNQYVGGLSNASASEGIVALAPQKFLPSALHCLMFNLFISSINTILKKLGSRLELDQFQACFYSNLFESAH